MNANILAEWQIFWLHLAFTPKTCVFNPTIKQTNHLSKICNTVNTRNLQQIPEGRNKSSLVLFTCNSSILLFLSQILNQSVLITFLQMNFSPMQTNNTYRISSLCSLVLRENYFRPLQLSNDSIQCTLHHQSNHKIIQKVPIFTEH